MDFGTIPRTVTGMDCLPSELLEMILIQLEMQFLLVTAQRVCQSWTACIRSSPAIQQKLFFRPLPGSEPVYNPLLAKHFPHFFPHSSGIKPLNAKNFRSFMARHKDVILRPGASWRNMLIQQPPIRSLEWTERVLKTGLGFDGFRRWLLPFEDGIRMSGLYDLLIVPIGSRKYDMTFYVLWRRFKSSENEGWLALDFTEPGLIRPDCVQLFSELVLETCEHVRIDRRKLVHGSCSWKLMQGYRFPCEDRTVSILRETLAPVERVRYTHDYAWALSNPW